MRRLATLLLFVLATTTVAAPAAVTRDRGGARPPAGAARTNVGGGVSIVVPRGWHVLRGWLSDTLYPIPRLAVASFPARLSRHTCECGFPNVIRFPRDGAFLFVWESTLPRHPRFPPPRKLTVFRITSARPQRSECAGPSTEFYFREGENAFQAEVYLGPRAGRAARARLEAVLESLRVAR